MTVTTTLTATIFMRRVLPIALLSLFATPSVAQDARRQLDAHAHGEGRLAIAIEGAKLQMELEAPASDIVGFEHAPSNAAQRKTLAEAKERLAKAQALFVLAPAAGCKLASASIEVLGALAGKGKPHTHAGHAHGEKAKPASKPAGSSAEPSAHSELKATYAFDCAAVDKLGSIAFDYFKAFKGADKLDVTVIGPKGQSSFVVTRQKPVLDLAGLS